jgi:hypothetical protein
MALTTIFGLAMIALFTAALLRRKDDYLHRLAFDTSSLQS